MTTLFISDLHLEESRPDITEAFLGFLNGTASGVDQLYILGDFFEAWIGDDERTPLQEQIAAALRKLRDSGTDIFLIGNGYAPEITVRDGHGKVVYSGPTVFLPTSSTYASWGVIKAPDASPTQLGFEGQFLPTLSLIHI